MVPSPARVLTLAIAITVATVACARDPITALNVQGCVRKNCNDADAVAYKACEASCDARYGR